eukprot:6928261-Pyramimonas_sp.AAC.1
MILDGVSLCRQLRHRNEDASHFCASHDDYQVFDGGKSRKVLAAELCVESMITSAKLAVLVFPSACRRLSRRGRPRNLPGEGGQMRPTGGESPRSCHVLAGLVSHR